MRRHSQLARNAITVKFAFIVAKPGRWIMTNSRRSIDTTIGHPIEWTPLGAQGSQSSIAHSAAPFDCPIGLTVDLMPDTPAPSLRTTAADPLSAALSNADYRYCLYTTAVVLAAFVAAAALLTFGWGIVAVVIGGDYATPPSFYPGFIER
ncbi:MAG: hypothetical protein NW216_03705 [Hyphomicrobium sp.]|nr:hypothetical protein [Hyphomicrobium sp.]